MCPNFEYRKLHLYESYKSKFKYQITKSRQLNIFKGQQVDTGTKKKHTEQCPNLLNVFFTSLEKGIFQC